MMALGAMILIFGFLAFNGASNLTISSKSRFAARSIISTYKVQGCANQFLFPTEFLSVDAGDGEQVGHAIASTAIAFASAAFGGFVASKLLVDRNTWHCSRVINAALTGQVRHYFISKN